jgi:hypothetical protein
MNEDNEWISVYDQEPRVNEQVLVYNVRSKHISQDNAYRDAEGRLVWFKYGRPLRWGNQLYWMPRPDPPKAENQVTTTQGNPATSAEEFVKGLGEIPSFGAVVSFVKTRDEAMFQTGLDAAAEYVKRESLSIWTPEGLAAAIHSLKSGQKSETTRRDGNGT